jgi:spore coat protein CotH
MSLTFRRSYPIIVLVIIVLSVLIFLIGDQRVIAYTTGSNSKLSTQKTGTGIDFINNVAVLDDSIVHSIEVLMTDEDHDKMISTYQETGLKEYFKVDVIIDGIRINEVGIRLKGNASLRTSVGGGMGGPGGGRNFPGGIPDLEGFPPQIPQDGQLPGFPGGREMPEGFQMPNPEELPQDGQDPPVFGNQGIERMNPFGATDGEVKIPYMIKFDEFVDGQTYQGYTSIALRTYGASPDAALLQEPLTNYVSRIAGIPATNTAFTGFKINEDEEKLYVISELVNQVYLNQNFSNPNGVLYKAEIGSTLNYKGDDPSSYTGSFTQQTRNNDADLLPLISFMKFLEKTDDRTFEAELPDWLDVDSFATYLAVNALVVNTDSMIGMNNNFYLYYDDVSGKFSVLIWDANESFGKLGGNTTFDISLTNIQTGLPGGGPAGGRMGGGMGGGIGGGHNELISRFLASPKFTALYYEKLNLVYELAFESGAVEEKVDQYSDLIYSINEDRKLVDLEAYDQAVENLVNFFNQRKEFLSTQPLLMD